MDNSTINQAVIDAENTARLTIRKRLENLAANQYPYNFTHDKSDYYWRPTTAHDVVSRWKPIMWVALLAALVMVLMTYCVGK